MSYYDTDCHCGQGRVREPAVIFTQFGYALNIHGMNFILFLAPVLLRNTQPSKKKKGELSSAYRHRAKANFRSVGESVKKMKCFAAPPHSDTSLMSQGVQKIREYNFICPVEILVLNTGGLCNRGSRQCNIDKCL